MLKDYPIQPKRHRWVEVIQFILLLVMFQSIIFLLDDGQEKSHDDIQFRVIAHSNEAKDQQEKEEIQQILMQGVAHLHETSDTTEQFHDQMAQLAPTLLGQFEELVPSRSVRFERKEAVIPPKRSGFYFQPQDAYDAYIVTIGSGRGDNWWCALFANVCYPAEIEETQEAPDEEEEEEEVTFFIWEWIKSLFS